MRVGPQKDTVVGLERGLGRSMRSLGFGLMQLRLFYPLHPPLSTRYRYYYTTRSSKLLLDFLKGNLFLLFLFSFVWGNGNKNITIIISIFLKRTIIIFRFLIQHILLIKSFFDLMILCKIKYQRKIKKDKKIGLYIRYWILYLFSKLTCENSFLNNFY